ncbi:MAG TPA: galactose mutarotase [Fermentimonas caenicola]|jgi:aldose 1-epimerase|uniref:Aldose 1-epimerase n=1 Tax=Fermentimonas caenicola TaxID=1562970 RepID=A0A098C2K7_9BACT|nr:MULTISPECIES: aldose epimerase family protein [Lascolabacillus]MBP6174926.1 galactose mutarotase [Fermentimonas sp.]MDI9626923.1 aldose epimerase family protein [Bacteroidota bacterium]TAH61789.1 MAG: galactose mutarotase [Fermentimonas caenicola]MBP6196100.1 galactose mutarotase [Fermentimonas sp.]MBP7104851.1 galactose mutarotase [Fermentimonas sp.]
MKKFYQIVLLLVVITVVACTNNKQETNTELATLSGIKRSDFQSSLNGDSIDLFVLSNANGVEVSITNYGGRIVSVMVPDRDGNMKDVVLGYDNIDDYRATDNNFGATIGRYGNRIAHGKITVEGVEYQLPQNNFGHTLHGGPEGFDKKVFKANQIDNQTLELTYLSEDGEAGFPGNLSVKVTMILTNDNAIDIQYEAETDKETIVNLTNHSYFNLSGDANKTILNDVLTINADQFTPVDDTFMTTGEILTVEGTPMDFRNSNVIGERIDNYEYEQLKFGDGYDHNWVLNTGGDISQLAASVYSQETGILLEVYTTEPGLQVYTGNFLDGTNVGKYGAVYNKRNAICLETQKYPDSPNKSNWPSPYLKPGETYTSRCIYKFSVEN